jgi:putative membrane protein
MVSSVRFLRFLRRSPAMFVRYRFGGPMPSVMRRTPFALACAAALVAACSKGDKGADSARAADSSAAAASATTPAAPAAPTMSDPNIVAYLDAVNMADSAGGSAAAAKGTNAEVKAFGRDMMRDHHALRVAGQDLAKKQNITPQPASNDTTQQHASKMSDSLNALARGAAWDKAYIDHEVAMHESVLSNAQTAAGATQNAELKALIEKAAPNIQAHLEHAKQIQSKLK